MSGDGSVGESLVTGADSESGDSGICRENKIK